MEVSMAHRIVLLSNLEPTGDLTERQSARDRRCHDGSPGRRSSNQAGNTPQQWVGPAPRGRGRGPECGVADKGRVSRLAVVAIARRQVATRNAIAPRTSL